MRLYEATAVQFNKKDVIENEGAQTVGRWKAAWIYFAALLMVLLEFRIIFPGGLGSF
jgi:hypothetical protein